MLRLSGSVQRHPYGKFPGVAVSDTGVVVEVHQPFISSVSINYQVGRLNGDEIDLSEPRYLDHGRYPKVAINNNNHVVQVHEGRYLRRIFYRIGTVPPVQPENADERPGRINWPDRSQLLDWGRFPAVAVHNNKVIVTYDSAYGVYSTKFCFGTIDEGGRNITWHPSKGEKLFSADAVETSVSMNAEHVVAAGRGWTSIVCKLGQFQEHQVPAQGQGQQRRPSPIQWINEIDFGRLGYCPTICLDEDSYVIMVWQSFSLRQLQYTTGTLQQDQLRLKPEFKNYGFGYNPTIALSPTEGKVVEEHETNRATFRCTLHYHTGQLDKNAAAIELPAGENRRAQHEPDEANGRHADVGAEGIQLDNLRLENNQQ